MMTIPVQGVQNSVGVDSMPPSVRIDTEDPPTGASYHSALSARAIDRRNWKYSAEKRDPSLNFRSTRDRTSDAGQRKQIKYFFIV